MSELAVEIEPMDPSTRFVRSLPGQYFMLREAAEQLGVSPRTLRRLNNATRDLPDEQKLGPSFCTYFGRVLIYLYTVEDIDKIREHLGSFRRVYALRSSNPVGRPRRWTPEERKERNRLYSRIGYHRKRAAALEDQGAADAAQTHHNEIAAAEKALKDMENA